MTARALDPRRIVPLLAVLFLALAVDSAAAQSGAADSKAAPDAKAAPDPKGPPVPDSYSYQAAGRRDPFLSLLGSGPQPVARTRKGEGLSGLAMGDISVRGVLESRGALVAMIAGPDKKTYIVHHGDKLLDATVKTITPQGLVLVQDVSDPLSVVKQREIRKMLRSLEDGK